MQKKAQALCQTKCYSIPVFVEIFKTALIMSLLVLKNVKRIRNLQF
jgi:hypothetical protein